MKIENGVLTEVSDSDIKDNQFTIPAGVTAIGRKAFEWCTDLTSIVIPEGVTSIGNEAFAGCFNLTSIVIPDSMTSIRNNAFEDSGITSITLSKNITSFGADVFRNCYDLILIVISTRMPYLRTAFETRSSIIPKIRINAADKEGYKEILDSLPSVIQDRVLSSYECFTERAMMLLTAHNHSAGFFKNNPVPKEIYGLILARLAEQYDIPPFMLNNGPHSFMLKYDLSSHRFPKHFETNIKVDPEDNSYCPCTIL